MAYYKHHVFFCVNQRQNGEQCCNDNGAQEMRDYAKKRVKELGLNGADKARINNAGCMDRCKEGPVIAIYPQGIWYSYVDKEDIDAIIDEHLVHDRVVERLKI